MPAQPGQLFAIICQGHEGQRTHTEYRFRVRHCGGCEWTVLRRYLDLLSLHERLCAVFGSRGLLDFPPKEYPSTAVDLVSSLLGVSIRPERIISEREVAFQKYFDVLCGRDDVVRTHIFQAALGVTPPEPVACLRVRGWLPSSIKGERALLDVRAEGQVTESSAVAETFHIIAKWGWRDPQTDAESELIMADIQIPATPAASGSGTVIDGLPAGAQVELEAQAVNVVGRSTKVSIRLIVPRPVGKDSEIEPEAATSERPSSSSAFHASEASAASRAPEQDPESELEKRRFELEQWWSQRRDEAERDDAERQRQMAEFSVQRAALEREREDFETERRLSRCSSPIYMSPAASPRDSRTECGEAVATSSDELVRQREELERQRQELEQLLRVQREAAATTEVGSNRTAEDVARLAELERLRVQQEALEQKCVDAEQQRVEEEVARHEQAEDLRKQEEELQRRSNQLARTEEILSAERVELQRSRASLAVVQAHVVSMLDKAETGGAAKMHRLDSDVDLNEASARNQAIPLSALEEEGGPSPNGSEQDPEDMTGGAASGSSFDKVWSMDWTSPIPRSASFPATAEAED